MKFLKPNNLFFVSLLFITSLVSQMPGIEDPGVDFPEGDLNFPQEVDMPLPSQNEISEPVSQEIPVQPNLPVQDVPIADSMPALPASMPGDVPVDVPGEPGQLPEAPPIAGQQASMAGASMAAPVVVQKPIEESQLPLIDVGPGKQENLTEVTPPLIQAQNVTGLERVLEQAEHVMQRIKNSLEAIENLRKNLSGQLANIDSQLDLSYQTIGFERGKQVKQLEKKEKEISRIFSK